MTTPNTAPTRKLIDVEKIIAVLDAEKYLVSATLVQALGPDDGAYSELIHSEALPEPGPLAVANCEHVGRCAMGSLLYASGKISYQALSDMDGDPSEWELAPVKVLYDTYGLQRYHAHEIIEANDADTTDDAETIGRRRQRVKERVRALAEEQKDDPAGDLAACQEKEERAAHWADDLGEQAHFEALGLDGGGYFPPEPDFD